MKVSLNTIKQFTNVECSVEDLVARINAQLGSVEEIIDLGVKYKDAKIVKIVECEKHENADKLSICKIDAGQGDLVQVVCGAPNVAAGAWAVWLPPESTVPSTFNDAEPFVLGARELRGVMSNGMLAASDELAIGSDHDGIVLLTDADLAEGKLLKAGANFAETFDLNDTIIDIENKMFTHRPDLFGQVGVAREIAAILRLDANTDKQSGHHSNKLDNFWLVEDFEDKDELSLEVFNESPEIVPRFMAVAIQNVKIEPSPMWLQTTLVRWGSKPISNVVDVTNYMMLLTSQPTHAYDYDKLRGHKLGARLAKKGETIKLLNDKDYQLDESDIVIADGEGPIGLAGIMGGGESEVSQNTKNIVLEVATFDMYAVRKSSMRHGVFTDALTRFNKGQSALQNNRVLKKLVSMMGDLTGGQQASGVKDFRSVKIESIYKNQAYVSNLSVNADFINERLGLKLNGPQVGNILRPAGFTIHPVGDNPDELSVNPPFWRTDIEIPEDLVEEVGRLYGFDKLPRELAWRTTKPAPENDKISAKQSIRKSLSNSGANEVLTYSFVSHKMLEQSEQDIDKAFRLTNALSPDLHYYRMSLLPSLLSHVRRNSKMGHGTFTIFEIGKAHHIDMKDSEGLPLEFGRAAGVYASTSKTADAAYFSAKATVDQLLDDHNITNVKYQPLTEFDTDGHDMLRQLIAPFDKERSAMLWIGDRFYGVVGEFDQRVSRSFKLPQKSAGFELFLSLFESRSKQTEYQPLSRFPSVTQDISLRVDSATQYEKVFDIANESLSGQDGISFTISPLAIYQADDGDDKKTITLRIVTTSQYQTLTDKTVAQMTDKVAGMAKSKINADRI